MGKKIKSSFDELDDQIIDVDEIAGTDVKINPDYYIHNAILNAQKSLQGTATGDAGAVKGAYVSFRVWVEHAQDLAEAAGMLTTEYHEKVKKIPEEIDEELDRTGEKTALPGYVRNARIASRKLKYMMTEVFSNKVSTGPLRA